MSLIATVRQHAEPNTCYRPKQRNYIRICLQAILCLVMIAQIAPAVPLLAQNLGTTPQFNKAVQGQQATTPEGTVLNIVNWTCNVIAPVVGVACLGVAMWHYKSGRGFGGWLVTGVGLMVISGLGRMAEGFITQAQGI